MQAAFITQYGGKDRVRLGQAARPVCGRHDILVEVRAAGVNPIDYKIRSGKVRAFFPHALPLVLGSELAGVVVETGDAVRRFQVGDAVFARLDKQRIGAFAEYALVAESAAAPMPAGLTFEQAAGLPLAALTAWQALVGIARLQPGQKVLIHGGSGGVGSLAIQLARHLGAHVVVTAGARNLPLMQELGAAMAIDYRNAHLERMAGEFDVVLDTVGEPALSASFGALKPGGVLVSVAAPVPTPAVGREHGVAVWLRAVLWLANLRRFRLAATHGVRYVYLLMHADGAQLERIAALVQAGSIRPLIDSVFRLDEIHAALARSESGRAIGKIVVVPGGPGAQVPVATGRDGSAHHSLHEPG
jgi:NADPH:quinone reductase-like Zn-dependent oxidoreductase